MIGKSWAEAFNKDEIKVLKEAYDEIQKRRLEIKEEILPLEEENSGIYNALKITDFNSIKVLIIGQDPYPNREDAHGLAFSKKNRRCACIFKKYFF